MRPAVRTRILCSLTVLTGLWMTAPTLAQEKSGLSSYSIIGIGDLRYPSGPRSAGMGYTGLALSSAVSVNPMAPATWWNTDRSRLEASVMFQGFNSTDGEISRYMSKASFYGAYLAIPLSTSEGIVFVGGFTPYSTVNYNTYTAGASPVPGGEFSYNVEQTGTGTLGRGFLGFSYRPFSHLSLGAMFNYHFGMFDRTLAQHSDTVGFYDGTITESARTHGSTFTFGALVMGLDFLSESLRRFSVGAQLTTTGNLSTTTQSSYDYVTSRDTSIESTVNFKLPLAYGIGLGYQPADRIVLAADYYAQPWSTAKFGETPIANVGDMFRTGVGVEFVGATEPNAPFLDRTSYRLGASYSKTYYDVSGQHIKEWCVTGGLSIPLRGENRIVVAFEYGKRGTLANQLILDTIYRASFSISISELWFLRPDEE